MVEAEEGARSWERDGVGSQFRAQIPVSILGATGTHSKPVLARMRMGQELYRTRAWTVA